MPFVLVPHQVAVLMVILDRLGFVGGEPWLETMCDTLSIQATLLHGRALSWSQSLGAYITFMKRIEAK